MQETPVANAKQAAHIAERYLDLQGLRQVAAGAGLLVLFGWLMLFPLTPLDARAMNVSTLLWTLLAVVCGFALAMVGVRWATLWYRREYGSVQRTASQRRLGGLIGGSGALAFLVPFNIESIATTGGHPLQVNLMAITLALWIVAYWFYIGRSFRHYLVLAGVGFVLGLVSIAGIPPANFVWHAREAILYFAVATMIGGYIDHRILISALSPAEKRVGVDS